jgi:hypothetical protein
MRKSLIAIVAFAVATSADGADRLRAHYELNVREGTDLSQALPLKHKRTQRLEG